MEQQGIRQIFITEVECCHDVIFFYCHPSPRGYPTDSLRSIRCSESSPLIHSFNLNTGFAQPLCCNTAIAEMKSDPANL